MSKLAEILFIKSSSCCVAVSKTLCKIYYDKYGINVHYIPNAIEIQSRYNATINNVNIESQFGLIKNNYILFVGRIIKTKGVMVLIDAYKKLKTDLKLVIVGDSSYTDDFFIKCKNEAKNNDRIMFLGSQSSDVVKALYEKSKFIVFPSEIEGLSLVLLEAFASLRPVIYSGIPENIEVAKGGGVQFKQTGCADCIAGCDHWCCRPGRGSCSSGFAF